MPVKEERRHEHRERHSGEFSRMAKDNYTFGDNDLASARLRRLAEIYEPETRELLQDSGVRTPHLAVDLGCGPGWSTSLLQEVLNPDCTVGLDASKHYI